jgi:hypothetical protein
MGITVLCLLLGTSSAPVAVQPDAPLATLVAIRAAHLTEITPLFDRVVFQINGHLPDSISRESVPKLVEDGSGRVVPVTGKGILHAASLWFESNELHREAQSS